MPCTSAIAFAVVNPTMTPPIRPGPAAAATPPSSAKTGRRFLHGRGNNAIEQIHMRAGGDFRHHAAERRVILDLRMHDVRQDAAGPVPPPFDHGGGGLIARGLDAQYQHVEVSQTPPKLALAFAGKPAFGIVRGT